MSKNTGGPAFPTFQQNMMNGHAIDEMSGMTLRDWYAGKALEGMLAGCMSNPDVIAGMTKIAENHKVSTEAYLAKQAYLCADEMLRARDL